MFSVLLLSYYITLYIIVCFSKSCAYPIGVKWEQAEHSRKNKLDYLITVLRVLLTGAMKLYGAPVFFRFFCSHTSINKCIVCKICCLSSGHKLRIEGTQEREQITLYVCVFVTMVRGGDLVDHISVWRRETNGTVLYLEYKVLK